MSVINDKTTAGMKKGMNHQRFMLWEKEVPYRSPESEFVPSITEYRIHGCDNAVLVCPGGGYKFKAEHEGPVIAEMINRAGISAFVLDYRVYPCKHQAPMNDALRAVRLIRSMGYQKVAILGFSAGGNVACCAATKYMDALLFSDDPVDKFDSRPDDLISCYSVVSMLDHTHEQSVQRLLGDEWQNVTLKEYYSAERHVSEKTPPAFIWHTSGDASVPVEDSLMLASAYAAHNVPFELHIFPGGRHGMGLAVNDPVVSQWTGLCMRWLKDQGY